jgi:peptidoglycan hydrolase-like protein with peptidoglycan-binding domain
VIQHAIQTKGSRVSRLDGRFTPTFARTVAKYQQRTGLVVDGMVGNQTRKALAIDWASKTAPSGIAYGKAPTFSTTDPGTFKRAIDMTDDELAAIVAKAKLTVIK